MILHPLAAAVLGIVSSQTRDLSSAKHGRRPLQGVHPFLRRKEPTALQFLCTLYASSFAVLAYSVLNENRAFWSAAKLTAGVVGCFLGGLCSSIAVYRLSPWHPLASYPGPALAKLSKWYMAYRIAKGDRHLLLQR
jgi:hypothetical protein